jgi:parallel beta-helix repeat protein
MKRYRSAGGLIARLLLLLSLLLGGLRTLAPSQSAATHISCGDTLTAQLTILDSDLTNCPGHGLIIGADNIVLDCQNHSIIGTRSGNGIILNAKNFVRIDRCNVMNFRAGFQLSQSTKNTFRRNVAQQNGDGFRLNDADENIFFENISAGNTDGDGFDLDHSSGNVFVGNFFNRNCVNGIELDHQCNDNVFVNNGAQQNGQHGFSLDASSFNTFERNSARFNGNQREIPSMVLCNTASHAPFFGNGFRVSQGSNDNTFTKNTAADDRNLDVCVAASGGPKMRRQSVGNIFVANEFARMGPVGLVDPDVCVPINNIPPSPRRGIPPIPQQWRRWSRAECSQPVELRPLATDDKRGAKLHHRLLFSGSGWRGFFFLEQVTSSRSTDLGKLIIAIETLSKYLADAKPKQAANEHKGDDARENLKRIIQNWIDAENAERAEDIWKQRAISAAAISNPHSPDDALNFGAACAIQI